MNCRGLDHRSEFIRSWKLSSQTTALGTYKDQVFAPIFCKELGNQKKKLVWLEDEKSVGKTALYNDTQDLQTVLMAISRADPKCARAALSRLLRANSSLRQVAEAYIRASSKSARETKDRIIEGICASIENNTSFSGISNKGRGAPL